MPRARRLASTVVVAALAVTGLAACNQAPSVAVYFGDKKAVTEDEVQRVWDDSSAKLTKNKDDKLVMPISRQSIVTVELYLAALKELGKEKGFSGHPGSTTEVAQQLTMQPDAAFVTLYAEFQGWYAAAAQQEQAAASAAPIAESDLRDIFTRIKAAGYPETYEKFAAGAAQLAQAGISPAIALRNDMKTEIANLKIKINPRYSAPTMVLASYPNTEVTIIDVAFGADALAPVKDLS
jgi:hypothetical protein